MSDAPVVVLAMAPVLTSELFDEEAFARLRAAVNLPDPAPLSGFGEPRAAELLARAEILLTGWGCAKLDEAVLVRAPALLAVVHAAGTVKNHVTEACFWRGLRVSSAAAANAVPVAEYALAAILFGGKRIFRLQRRYREVRAFRMWAREVPDPSNYGKVVGIVGASGVGLEFGTRSENGGMGAGRHTPSGSFIGDSAGGKRWSQVPHCSRWQCELHALRGRRWRRCSKPRYRLRGRSPGWAPA